MKKIKNIIILLVVLVIIIISIVLTLIIKNKTPKEELERIQSETKDINEDISDDKPVRTNRINTFYTIENCIKSYLQIVNSKDQTAVIKLLNKSYISENNITSENVFNYIVKNNNSEKYNTIEMYELNTLEYTSFYVEGILNKQSKIFFEVGLDSTNNTFDIMPISESVYNKRISETSNVNKGTEKKIEKNEYNNVEYKDYDNADIAKLYFDDYINKMLTDTETAYNMLDKDYREKRFGNIDNFRSYVNENKEKLELTYKVDTLTNNDFELYSDYVDFKWKNSNLGIKQYSVETRNEYVQYICADAKENYYIFNAKYPMDYTVILDAYTIDLPDVLEKYNSSSNENKVAMNIEKIKTAINNKDYRYVYNKLNNTFKETNFKTEESLKEYLQSNIYINNNFECSSVQKQDNVYVAQVKVMNMDNTTQTKKIKVVMKLKEGTDYEMSFSIQ